MGRERITQSESAAALDMFGRMGADADELANNARKTLADFTANPSGANLLAALDAAARADSGGAVSIEGTAFSFGGGADTDERGASSSQRDGA